MSNRNRQRRYNTRQDHMNDDRWFDDGGSQGESGYSSEGRSRTRSNGGGNGGGFGSSHSGSQGGSGYGRTESGEFEGGWGHGDSGRGYGEAGYPGQRNFSDQGRNLGQGDHTQESHQGSRYGSSSSNYGGQGGYVQGTLDRQGSYGTQGGYGGSHGSQSNFGQGVNPSSQHGFQQSQGNCPECGHTHRGAMGERGYQSQGQMGGQSYGSSSGWGQGGGQFGSSRQGQGGYDIPTDHNEGGYPPYSRSGSSGRRQSQSDDSTGNWGSQGSHQSWGNRQDSSSNRAGGNVSSDWWSYEGQRPNRSGKGPKGYKRSDERIKEDVNDRLCDGSIDASDVDVKVQNGEVTLTGTVESRRIKFHVETIAEQVLGVIDVNNQLRVSNQPGIESSSRSGSDNDEKSSQSKSTSKTSSTSMTSGAR